MKLLGALLCAATVLQVVSGAMAQAPPWNLNVPIFRSTTTLVFLDVTVLDKKGQPVVTGLTKNDFAITEDKKPQSIFSFEAPEVHKLKKSRNGSDNPDGSAPVTIFVLDLLNSKFEDFAYIRYSVQKYLEAQPADNGESKASVLVGAASRSDYGEILASKLQRVTLTAETQDAAKLAIGMARVHVALRVPAKTRNVRIVMQSGNGGRIGAADLSRAAIDVAPAAPTPNPQLTPQHPEQNAPPSL